MSKSIVAGTCVLLAVAVVGCPNTESSGRRGTGGESSLSGPGSGAGSPTTSSGGGASGGGGSSSGPSSGGGGNTTSSTNAGGSGAGTSSGGGGGSGGSVTVGGTLHFLQSPSVSLKNGADTLELDDNGDFTFPIHVTVGDTYDVTVKTQPADQKCWVQNGSGTASANVNDIDVRCSTILQSKSNGTKDLTSSASLVPIANIAPISFTTDIAANVLATLLIPKVLTYQPYHLVLELDGTPIRDVDFEPLGYLAGVTLAVTNVSPGTHTLTPYWSTPATQVEDFADAYTSEMDLLVLESLPSFDQLFSATLASNAGQTALAMGASTPVAMGFTPLAVDIPGAAQPAFAALLATDIRGDRFGARLMDGSQPLSSSVMSYDIGGHKTRTLTPMAVTQLAPGVHAIDAQWFSTIDSGGVSTRGGQGLSSSLQAILFKSATLSGSQALLGYQAYSLPATFTTLGNLSVTLALPKASKVLVTFDAMNIRLTPNHGQDGDFAIFVNGVQQTLIHAHDDNNIDLIATGLSMVGIVDAPSGNVTFDVRMRVTSESATGAGPPVLELDHDYIAPADSLKAGIGVIVLE